MLDAGLLEHSEQRGRTALGLLKKLVEESSIVGEARGRGLMPGVEFVSDKQSKKPAPELARRARTLCHQRGVMIEVGGHYGNVARFLPPLVITEELLRKGIEIFIQAVHEMEKHT